MSDTPGSNSASEESDDAPVASDEAQNAGVTISDEDPERARRIAAALAVDSDEAPPVAT